MKTKYELVFASHVGAKLTKAKELGIVPSWTTANHLDALAEVLLEAAQQSDPELALVAVRDALGECYNVSAFQQMLAKKFEKLGHFQREGKKPVSEQADDVFAMLARETEGKTA